MTSTTFDPKKPVESLEAIKNAILEAVGKEEVWYRSHREAHARLTKLIRFVACLLFAFGIIWPFINSGIDGTDKMKVNVGYISLAIGGLLMLLDKYLGISAGYVRFYVTELDIQKNTLEFKENWNIEMARSSQPPSVENILSLLNQIKQFRQAISQIIQVETRDWATEFQAQSGELFELFKQQQQAQPKTSSISVIVDNTQNYKAIEIGLNDEPGQNLNGNTSAIFRGVSPQLHMIKVKAINAQNLHVAFSRNIVVEPGKIIEVKFAMP